MRTLTSTHTQRILMYTGNGRLKIIKYYLHHKYMHIAHRVNERWEKYSLIGRKTSLVKMRCNHMLRDINIKRNVIGESKWCSNARKCKHYGQKSKYYSHRNIHVYNVQQQQQRHADIENYTQMAKKKRKKQQQK